VLRFRQASNNDTIATLSSSCSYLLPLLFFPPHFSKSFPSLLQCFSRRCLLRIRSSPRSPNCFRFALQWLRTRNLQPPRRPPRNPSLQPKPAVLLLRRRFLHLASVLALLLLLLLRPKDVVRPLRTTTTTTLAMTTSSIWWRMSPIPRPTFSDHATALLLPLLLPLCLQAAFLALSWGPRRS
jgi:hypothetical protein